MAKEIKKISVADVGDGGGYRPSSQPKNDSGIVDPWDGNGEYGQNEIKDATKPVNPYKDELFATLGDIFRSKKSELNDVKKRYLGVMTTLLSKVSKDPDLTKIISERLELIINGIELGPNGQKLGFEVAKNTAGSNRIMDIFKQEVANLASEYGLYQSDTQTSAFGPPWSASQWSNLLQALKSRAVIQSDQLEKKIYEETDESRKKAYELRKAMKVSYVRQIETLQSQLADIKNKNGISGDSAIPDQIISQYYIDTQQSKNRRGGTDGIGGTGGRGGYGENSGNEGEAQEANNKRLQLKPFTSQANGDLPIKQLLRAYNLDNDSLFRSVMDAQAPDVLIAKDWLSLNYYPVSKHLIALVAEGTEASEYMARLYYAIVAINKAYKQATTQYGGEPDKKETDTIAKWLNAINIYRTDKHGVGRGRSYIEDEANERRNKERGKYNTETTENQVAGAPKPTTMSPAEVWKANYSKNVKYYDSAMNNGGFVRDVNNTFWVSKNNPRIAVKISDGAIYKRDDTNRWFNTGKNLAERLK